MATQNATKRLIAMIDPALLNLALTDAPQTIDEKTRKDLQKYNLSEHYTDSRILSFYGGPVFEIFICEAIREREKLAIDYKSFSELHSTMINQHAFITALDNSDSDVCFTLNKLSSEFIAKRNVSPAVAGVLTPAEQLKYASSDHFSYTQNQHGYLPPPIFNCAISMTAILGALFVQLGFSKINEIKSLFNELVDTKTIARVALTDARDLNTAETINKTNSGATTLSYAASKRRKTTTVPTPPAVQVPVAQKMSPFVSPVVLPATTTTTVLISQPPKNPHEHKLPSLSMPFDKDLTTFTNTYLKQSGLTLDINFDTTTNIVTLVAIEMKNNKKYLIKQYQNNKEIDDDLFKYMLIDSGIWTK